MAAATRRSLANLRRLLSQKLNGYQLATTTSLAPNTTSIVCTDLAGGLDANEYRLAWVMPTTTGSVDPATAAQQIRRVVEQGLNLTSGALTVSAAFSEAVKSGVDVEIHTMLPPTTRNRVLGLRECLNLALAECWFPQRLPITGVAGSPSYSLSAYAEWLEADMVDELYGPALDSTLTPFPWPGFGPLANAEALTLQVSPTFAAGAAALAEITRPGDTYVRTGGVWATSTTGLVFDTDECLFQPGFLVEVALYHAYMALASGAAESGERALWDQKASRQRMKANTLKVNTLAHPSGRLSHGLAGGSAASAKDFASW